MHVTISLLLFITLGLIYGVIRRAMLIDREAPTDPGWYDIRHFHEAADIIDDEDMRTLLDECLTDGTLDTGMTIRAWALIGYFNDGPNSLHNPIARSTSKELAGALEDLLERIEGHADRESIAKAVERADAAYLAYRSYFYDLLGE